MVELGKLRDERLHKCKSVEDIRNKVREDDRHFNPDEVELLSKLYEDIRSLDERILQLEQREAILKESGDIVATIKDSGFRSNATDRVVGPEQPKGEPAERAASENRVTVPAIAKKYSSLKAFKGPDADLHAYRTGQWLRAMFYGDSKAQRWCVNHGMEVRALSEGVAASGGYLVPDEMQQTIINLREEYGVFRQNCSVVPMGRDTITIPRRASGVTATFTAEAAALTESDPAFNDVQLAAKKLGVLTKVSSELAEDAIINIADYVVQEFALAFAKKEDECGFAGTGAVAYGGIIGTNVALIDGTHTASAVDATAATDTYAEVDADDLNAMIGRTPSYAHAGAKFYGSRIGVEIVFGGIQAAAGGNTMTDLAGKPQRQYLGYPIVVVPGTIFQTATTSLDNLVMFLFGDLSQAATMGDRREIRVGLSEHVYWANDQIGIKATERFDINVHDLGDNTNAGPLQAMVGVT